MENTKEQKNNQSTQNVSASLVEKVLIEPLITEAAAIFAEENKYVFKVGTNADKQQIKRSIETLYSVKVIGVNTLQIPRKKRRTRNSIGWKTGFKKAVVTLKKGDKISLYE